MFRPVSNCLRNAVLIVIASACAASAERLPLKVYTTADGLPHNEINRIVRDSRGFLWFCTADGLSRFDGYTFTNYGDDEGMPHGSVTDLLETRDHRYFVATSAGLWRFDPAGAPVRQIEAVRRSRPTVPSIFTVVVPDDPDPLARSITVLLEDRAGTIWVGTAKGLYRLEQAAGRFALHAVEIGLSRNYAEQAMIDDILEDRRGSLWIATPRGLYRRWRDGSAARYTTQDGLPDDFVHDLLEDRSGRLWAATRGGGFFRLTATDSHDPPIVAHAYSVRDGLPSSWVFQLFETTDHRFWIATADGLAELVENSEEGSHRFRVYGTEHGLTYHDITTLAEDTGGNLWIGTNTAGVMKLARNGAVTYGPADGIAVVNAIFEDETGALCFRGGPPLAKAESNNIRFGCLDGQRVDWFKPAAIDSDNIGWVMERVTLQTRSGVDLGLDDHRSS